MPGLGPDTLFIQTTIEHRNLDVTELSLNSNQALIFRTKFYRFSCVINCEQLRRIYHKMEAFVVSICVS